MSALLTVSIVGLWAGAVYEPTAIVFLSRQAGMALSDAARMASYGTGLLSIRPIFGCIAAPRLAPPPPPRPPPAPPPFPPLFHTSPARLRPAARPCLSKPEPGCSHEQRRPHARVLTTEQSRTPISFVWAQVLPDAASPRPGRSSGRRSGRRNMPTSLRHRCGPAASR